jgi:HSP20 family protein
MTGRDLTIRGQDKRHVPMRRESEHPFFALQHEMNRLMGELFGDRLGLFGLRDMLSGSYYPQIDLKETDKEFELFAELPGIDEKDIELTLSGDELTIRGEKRFDKEEKQENYRSMERHYGTFRRVISLPEEVDTQKVEATFDKGVLHIRLPRTERAKTSSRKIQIKSSKTISH